MLLSTRYGLRTVAEPVSCGLDQRFKSTSCATSDFTFGYAIVGGYLTFELSFRADYLNHGRNKLVFISVASMLTVFVHSRKRLGELSRRLGEEGEGEGQVHWCVAQYDGNGKLERNERFWLVSRFGWTN